MRDRRGRRTRIRRRSKEESWAILPSPFSKPPFPPVTWAGDHSDVDGFGECSAQKWTNGCNFPNFRNSPTSGIPLANNKFRFAGPDPRNHAESGVKQGLVYPLEIVDIIVVPCPAHPHPHPPEPDRPIGRMMDHFISGIPIFAEIPIRVV